MAYSWQVRVSFPFIERYLVTELRVLNMRKINGTRKQMPKCHKQQYKMRMKQEQTGKTEGK